MKDKITMILFVLVLGSILTSSLVFVDAYTDPIIAKNVAIKLKSSVLNALDIPFDVETVESVFSAKIEERQVDEQTIYVAEDGTLGLPFEGSGLWGPIIGVLAMSPDLVNVRGITIMQQEETPGLGSRIGEKEYLDLFVGKKFTPEITITPPGKAVGDSQVDAISGATMSSNAFVAILNDQRGMYASLMDGGK